MNDGAREFVPVRIAVLTVSDTRTPETDKGGALIRDILVGAGHRVDRSEIVPDDADAIRAILEPWTRDPALHAVITTGGTGIARRDTTIEVVERLVTVPLDGFGELFRMLSWEEVGAAAMLSRATAGLVVHPDDPAGDADTLLFALPGSTNAVRTAMERLIAPEIAHLVWERRR